MKHRKKQKQRIKPWERRTTHDRPHTLHSEPEDSKPEDSSSNLLAWNQGRDARSTLESSGSESLVTRLESSGLERLESSGLESLESSGLEESFQTSAILVLPA